MLNMFIQLASIVGKVGDFQSCYSSMETSLPANVEITPHLICAQASEFSLPAFVVV